VRTRYIIYAAALGVGEPLSQLVARKSNPEQLLPTREGKDTSDHGAQADEEVEEGRRAVVDGDDNRRYVIHDVDRGQDLACVRA